jgi:hypothetical protein
LPASICAMIPMFRQRFRGVVRATVYLSSASIARGKYNVEPENSKQRQRLCYKTFLYQR